MSRHLLILTITLCSMLLSYSVSFAAFRDIKHHWSGEAANTLIQNEIMYGYSDGSFKPDNNITKEEFCVLLKSFGEKRGFITAEALTNAEAFESVEDVKNQWSSASIKYFLNQEVVCLSTNNLFEPSNDLTRAEMAQAIYSYRVNIEGHIPSANTEMSENTAIAENAEAENAEITENIEMAENMEITEAKFSDIDGIPQEIAIRALYSDNIITGYEDATFRPEKPITRGEISVIFYRMSGLEPISMEVDLPMYNLIEVPYISQLYPIYAPVGCEGTAMLMALKSKGYAADLDLKMFLDDMPKDSQNPSRGFVGSPYKPDREKKTRTTIFPEKLTEFGSKYGKLANISGSSVNDIQEEILAGNPVVVYATMNWEKPFYRYYNIDGENVRLLSNNHVILVNGYNSEKNEYFISDPYNLANNQKELKYWIDGATFEPIYNERKQAIVVE